LQVHDARSERQGGSQDRRRAVAADLQSGYDSGGPAGRSPDRLLGYPIQINQDVAVMAANGEVDPFGDFSYYKIRDVMDVTMFRFEDFRLCQARPGRFPGMAALAAAIWRLAPWSIDVGGSVKSFVNAAS
jgi:hypothetical protein